MRTNDREFTHISCKENKKRRERIAGNGKDYGNSKKIETGC